MKVDAAADGVVVPQDQADQSGLSAARFADESSLAALDLQLEALEQRFLVVVLHIAERHPSNRLSDLGLTALD